MNIHEKIDDLIKQATVERSHFYVKAVLEEVKETLAWYELKHEQRRNQVYEAMEENAMLRIEVADAKAEIKYLEGKVNET